MKKGFRIIKFKKNKPIFQIRDISKSFDGRPILKKISMEMNAGEIVGLLGPNGSGKSTLYSIIIGEHQAESGKIYITKTGTIRLDYLKPRRFTVVLNKDNAVYHDHELNEISVRSSIIRIGTTAAGISTYRFKSSGQIDGSERTVRFESNFANVSVATTVSSFLHEEVSSFKSIVRVSSGSTSALHQVLVVHDETDTFTTQYPFLSIGSTSGIGTFSSSLKGNNLNFNFHPDPEFTGGTNNVQVQILNKIFYTDIDLLNIPLDLQYGTSTESLSVAQYDAINGNRANKTSFVLQSNTKPIFQKNFNPSDPNVLNLATGEFSIVDHFFETGEQIIYKAGSTFTGA